MPLPTKKSGETKKSFIDRCMGSSVTNRDFPDVSQRRAVCESQWNKKDKVMSQYSNILEQLWTSQWAILPEMLDTMHQIVETRLNDGKLSLEEIEIRINKNDKSENGSYTTDNKIRVIPIHGVIAKRMNLFSKISGGTSTELLKTEIETAIADDSVKSILLDIESPGGSVDGPFELSDFIYASRGQKPIYAFANGLMASAAYLIGSAADNIIGTQTAQIGSIGVITKHMDYSRRDEQNGVITTIITSGKYKAIGAENKPLSKEDKQYIQSRLDYFYTMFVNSIARNRNVSTEKVLSDMADGRIFIGRQAQDAGLIDSIGTFETGLEQCCQTGGIRMSIDMAYAHNSKLKEDESKWSTYIKANRKDLYDQGLIEEAHLNRHANTISMGEKGGEKKMTLDELKNDKELYNEMKAEVQTEMKSDGFEARVADLEAKLAERDSRILALEKENEKREAMRIETERRIKAQSLIAAKLSDSQIPERLFSKITNLIDCSQFMKDEDVNAFAALIDAEIKDWEGLGVMATIGGLSVTTKTDVKSNNEDEADEARANNLFAFVK